MQPSPNECARQLLETLPLVMQTIGPHMRAHGTFSLSVPQFRSLMFLSKHEGASLSDVADHLGLSLPSTSKLVDGLVARGVVMREIHPGDRRRVTLRLTAGGRDRLRAAREIAQAHLARVLVALPPAERGALIQAMHALRGVFTTDREQQVKRAGVHRRVGVHQKVEVHP
jgi:DNA-binding MarR family transcriptional regulator